MSPCTRRASGREVLHYLAETSETGVGNVVEVLPLAHDAEFVVGYQSERLERAIYEGRVLPGQRQAQLSFIRSGPQSIHHGRHLDRLGPCTDNGKDAGSPSAICRPSDPSGRCTQKAQLPPGGVWRRLLSESTSALNCAIISATRPKPNSRNPTVSSKITR